MAKISLFFTFSPETAIEHIMIELRPHHLLCILTYVGKGYTPAFVEKFTQTVKRINNGERDIKIVKGPDVICQPMLGHEECHCYEERILDRDQNALNDLGLNYSDEIILTKTKIAEMREQFAKNKIRRACKGCQWKDLCSEIAKDGFKGTFLIA